MIRAALITCKLTQYVTSNMRAAIFRYVTCFDHSSWIMYEVEIDAKLLKTASARLAVVEGEKPRCKEMDSGPFKPCGSDGGGQLS